MTRKRRMFEIDLPEDDAAVVAPSNPEPQVRRGPMASAIAENAEALRARKSAAEAIREENDALAHEFVALKEAGHVVQSVPLDDVHSFMLVRDRLPGEDPELDELIASIRDIGLSNPIRVFPRQDGTGFELVQGFRRLSAYRWLAKKTGDEKWLRIPALVTPPETDIGGLYRRMVDENIVRKDLSFAEMAHAARNYLADPATRTKDLSEAVSKLFQSAPYSKRSYIRSFAMLLDYFGDDLKFATEIPRALGVSLAREVKARPAVVRELLSALRETGAQTAEEELDILRRNINGANDEAPAEVADVVKKPSGKPSRTKTTFHMRSTAGQVKCTASQGRLEIRVDRDFSAIDRARLEQAIASLIDGLN